MKKTLKEAADTMLENGKFREKRGKAERLTDTNGVIEKKNWRKNMYENR